ncbi:hypothetical protein GGR58DRAFT_501208 [Xylaria digitata]|nr:hypothetical protein GGR58DRAFT_501208 [Xylaria digitata]
MPPTAYQMDTAELAIGLAGTILKLVIFFLDFIGDVKQVYKQGATDRNVDLSTIAESVATATTSLEKQLGAISANAPGEGQVSGPDEEWLKELSRRAADIGRELAQKLSRVTTDKKSTWKSLKAVALGMWDADEIEKVEKRLNAIKDEIQFRIIGVAQKQARSKADSTHMIQLLNDADKVGQGRHEELVNLGNQLLKAINAIPISSSPTPTLSPPALITSYDENALKAAEGIILSSLWYPSIRDREETIAEAHADTFQWIFEDPTTIEKPWDSFVEFLRGDSSSFWITGKPASGKSTLVKFINSSPRTQALLQQWAGERVLLRASYYFYYTGGEHQKSEIGLIRSLLYSILDRRRELIRVAFGERLQAALEGRKYHDPSLPEAKMAFRNLMLHSSNLSFFISIDGLDEFDPAVSLTHVQSLIDFTHFLKECGNVKLLVSSRPLPEFERGYNGLPSLRIHDLTREDIRRYANEKLVSHPRMNSLAKKDPERTGELLQSIVDSSLGVFLWVRVVTESLLEGLTNYDSIGDLKERLDGLPSDLEDLYRTMLSRINPKYKPQTARLLCFVHHTKDGSELTPLDLWFAENATNHIVSTTQVKPIEDEEVRERVQELETLVKSRCLGLIETAPTWLSASTRFLHRSVYEFLNRQDVWDEVVGGYLDHTFSASLSLFRSSILIIKTFRPYPCMVWRNIIHRALYAATRAKAAELETKRAHPDLIHELDLAMRGIMPLVHLSAENDVETTSLPDRRCHWSVWFRYFFLWTPDGSDSKLWPLDDKDHGCLMAFAADNGLDYYIQSQIAEKGRGVLIKEGLPLLGYALMPSENLDCNRGPHYETTKLLLNSGCVPSQLYRGTSLWEWFLWTIPYELERTSGINATFVDFIELDTCLAMDALLLVGAEPNARMLYPSRDETARPLDVLKSWNLPWNPLVGRNYQSGVCTVLLALTRMHQGLRNVIVTASRGTMQPIIEIDKTIQRMIKFLRESGAVEEEWNDNDSMRRIFLQVGEKLGDRQSLTIDDDTEVTEPSKVVQPGTPDTPLVTAQLGVSTVSEVHSDAASSNGPEMGRENSKSEISTVDKKTREVRPTANPDAVANTTRLKTTWRMRYGKLLRKIKHSLRRLK